MHEQSPAPLSFCVLPSRIPGREHPEWIDHDDQEARNFFDSNTLFYDVFRASKPGSVFAVGPALQRPFRTFIKQAKFRLDGAPAQVTEVSQSRRSSTLEFTSSVAAPAILEVEHPSASFIQAIVPSMIDKYAGTRALFTLSHNNELDWIRDWARLHVDMQGVESIVLFDNASTKYGVRDLLGVLGSVPGLKAFDVVSVPFQYGPKGSARKQISSRFLQFGVFEIARRRFLQQAAGVLNLDIDELAFSPPNLTVFDQLGMQEEGFLTLPGEWRYPKRGAALRHASHVMRAEPETETMYPKWCLAPQGPQKDKIWRTHGLKGLPEQISENFGFLHCRMISNHWHYDRAEFAARDLVTDPLAQRVLGDEAA